MVLTPFHKRLLVVAVLLLVGLYVIATLVRWLLVGAVIAIIAFGVLWWLRRSLGGSGERP